MNLRASEYFKETALFSSFFFRIYSEFHLFYKYRNVQINIKIKNNHANWWVECNPIVSLDTEAGSKFTNNLFQVSQAGPKQKLAGLV